MNVVAEGLRRKKETPITPLIDVVFLLLVYFMITSSLIKKEADLSFELPFTDGSLPNHAIEVLVEITELGRIVVEGESFDDRHAFLQRLELLKTAADTSNSELIVSILPSDETKHGEIVPVMDACAGASVRNLSFNTSM